MPGAQILICYDGSDGADRAIDAAADLLGTRSAVVLDVGPPLTTAESYAVTLAVAPAAAFGELNANDALTRARAGAERVLSQSRTRCVPSGDPARAPRECFSSGSASVRGGGGRRAPCPIVTPERRRPCPGAVSSASPRRRRRRRAGSRRSLLPRPPSTTARRRLQQPARHCRCRSRPPRRRR